MNTKKTLIAIVGALTLTVGLAACGSSDEPGVADIPEVVVDAPASTPAPSSEPTDEPAPDVVKTEPAGPATPVEGDTVSIEAKVGTVVGIPWTGPNNVVVDVAYFENDGVLAPISDAPRNAPWYDPSVPPPSNGMPLYAAKAGTAKGVIRVLDEKFQPTDEGVNFTVTVTP